ncbi:E3 ubiquitin-protein ligase RNF144A-like [Onychostoma macrolepis]|uniref:E3 ubiquitin-protein ligase RNF144A-like n=1 Tax=Onychostoma macrolepis TaxID=369639 RepID=UPI00272CDA87|nr:E3 ubiquitin-protein ligase RNF144A-like [Onychostoma macrolepis]
MNVPKCPSCHQSDVRVLDGQYAICKPCSKLKRSVFQFCLACQREWPRNSPTTDSCTLPNCSLRAALLSNTEITDPHSSVRGCPYFRACPGCKALLTHNGKGCPNIICPHCRTAFCFRCLRQRCFGMGNIEAFLLANRGIESPFQGYDITPCRVVDNKQSLTVFGL